MSIYEERDGSRGFRGPERVNAPDLDAPVMWEHDPAHEPRTGLALRLSRLALGLSADDLATYLGCNPRTLKRWEHLDAIPGWVETAMRHLAFLTDMWQQDLADSPGAQVRTYTHGYRMLDGRPIPEAWWRNVVGRQLLMNPLMAIEAEERK